MFSTSLLPGKTKNDSGHVNINLKVFNFRVTARSSAVTASLFWKEVLFCSCKSVHPERLYTGQSSSVRRAQNISLIVTRCA